MLCFVVQEVKSQPTQEVFLITKTNLERGPIHRIYSIHTACTVVYIPGIVYVYKQYPGGSYGKFIHPGWMGAWWSIHRQIDPHKYGSKKQPHFQAHAPQTAKNAEEPHVRTSYYCCWYKKYIYLAGPTVSHFSHTTAHTPHTHQNTPNTQPKYNKNKPERNPPHQNKNTL